MKLQNKNKINEKLIWYYNSWKENIIDIDKLDWSTYIYIVWHETGERLISFTFNWPVLLNLYQRIKTHKSIGRKKGNKTKYLHPW